MRLIDADALAEDIKKRYCRVCDNEEGQKCKICWIEDMICEIVSAPKEGES